MISAMIIGFLQIKKRPTFPWSADVRVSSLWLTVSKHQNPTGYPRGSGSGGSHTAKGQVHNGRIYITVEVACQEEGRKVYYHHSTVTIEPRGVFSTSIRLGKASFNSSRWVMIKIFAKSTLTRLMASISRWRPWVS